VRRSPAAAPTPTARPRFKSNLECSKACQTSSEREASARQRCARPRYSVERCLHPPRWRHGAWLQRECVALFGLRVTIFRKRACALDQPRSASGRPRGQECCHAPCVTALSRALRDTSSARPQQAPVLRALAGIRVTIARPRQAGRARAAASKLPRQRVNSDASTLTRQMSKRASERASERG